MTSALLDEVRAASLAYREVVALLGDRAERRRAALRAAYAAGLSGAAIAKAAGIHRSRVHVIVSDGGRLG